MCVWGCLHWSLTWRVAVAETLATYRIMGCDGKGLIMLMINFYSSVFSGGGNSGNSEHAVEWNRVTLKLITDKRRSWKEVAIVYKTPPRHLCGGVELPCIITGIKLTMFWHRLEMRSKIGAYNVVSRQTNRCCFYFLVFYYYIIYL
jgi:hypothetical protein